jgi:2',3'-cyclic-nucleotide 2'-phosphodiesterase (5'-nucleotidase family)
MAPGGRVAEKVVLLVQLNDLYQIDTSADYTDDAALILPRISTLVSRLRNIYGHDRVRFCLPGDFLAPSCLSKEFKGKQMVDILNRMGLDFVSFGNHEFEREISTCDLVARMDQSRFKWLNVNFEFWDDVLHDRLIDSDKMHPVESIRLSESHDLLLFGVLNTESPEHVGRVHKDPKEFLLSIFETAREAQAAAARATPARDVGFTFVAMTHQKLNDDRKLAKECPELALIMGGHDHNVHIRSRVKRCLIVKAASNARTLRLNWVVAVPRFPAEGTAPPDPETERDRFATFAKELLGRVAVKPLRQALLRTRRPSAAQAEDLYQFVTEMGFADQRHEIDYRVEGNELIFVISSALNTRHPAFQRLIPSNAKLHNRIRSWNKKSKHSEAPIIIAPVELVLEDARVRRCSTNFGNLTADIMRGHLALRAPSRLEADVGLINSGSFRIDRNIERDEPISPRTMCDVFYHPNKVNRYTLKGEALTRLLEQSLVMDDNYFCRSTTTTSAGRPPY